MSSSPLPIRRAGPTDVLSLSAKDNLAVTPSGHLYGSTPGGTRIVYSREQLLSLASSPLSKTPPNIPAEISRSPEKLASHNSQAVNTRSNGVIGSIGKGGQVFGTAQASHNGLNGNAVPTQSPPAHTSRSPGNAFNFSNGPISPTSANHSTSFKERLAQAQRTSSPPARRGDSAQILIQQQRKSDASDGINNGVHGDEQFKMDM